MADVGLSSRLKKAGQFRTALMPIDFSQTDAAPGLGEEHLHPSGDHLSRFPGSMPAERAAVLPGWLLRHER